MYVCMNVCMYEFMVMENTWFETAAEGIDRVWNSYEIPKCMVSIYVIFYPICIYVCFCMYVCMYVCVYVCLE